MTQRYKLNLNFADILGDSWSAIVGEGYRESFLEEINYDYQNSPGSVHPTVIENIIDEEAGTNEAPFNQAEAGPFDPSRIIRRNQVRPVYSSLSLPPSDEEEVLTASFYPLLSNQVRTNYSSLSVSEIFSAEPDITHEQTLYALDCKAKRLDRDLTNYKTRVLSSFRERNHLNQEWWLETRSDIRGFTVLQEVEFIEERYREIARQYRNIVEQLNFEGELFYWQNIRSFEDDLNAEYERLVGPEHTLEYLRDREYKYAYSKLIDRSYTIGKPFEKDYLVVSPCDFVGEGYSNPHRIDSDQHFSVWSKERNRRYRQAWHAGEAIEDEFWNIEADYHKELVFEVPWSDAEGYIPDKSTLVQELARLYHFVEDN